MSNQTNTAAHASDCATHNAPAYEAGQCDCGVKTAAHTPGPYTRNGVDIINSEGRIIATVRNRIDNRRVSYDEADANAILFAAAPDLHTENLYLKEREIELEAVLSELLALMYEVPLDEHGQNDRVFAHYEFDRTRAVLAKSKSAKGCAESTPEIPSRATGGSHE